MPMTTRPETPDTASAARGVGAVGGGSRVAGGRGGLRRRCGVRGRGEEAAVSRACAVSAPVGAAGEAVADALTGIGARCRRRESRTGE